MPKSRRKAAASRAKAKGGIQKDFVKKKERLGRKARPDNATNTSVKSKHIYLPQIPDEQEVHDAALKRGLTYEQLLQRVSHYNASTRMSALNGLARALREGTFAASLHAKSDRANVVRIALAALQDDEGVVRRAAVALLAAVVHGVVTVRPFARILASSWLAGLSHIRTEVQEAAAGSMAAVFREGVRPTAVFSDSVHKPLQSLAEMLNAPGASVRNTPKRRTCVLEALVALLEGEKVVVGGGTRKTLSRNTAFYWQSLKQDEDDINVVKESCSSEMNNVLTLMTKRIANIVSECLPVHEAKKDKGIIALLLLAVKCLFMSLSLHTVEMEARKPVVRMLNSWAKERNRHHEKGNVHVLHNYLAACALMVNKHELATTYLELTLSEEGVTRSVGEDAISVEILIEKALDTLENEEVTKRILNLWLARWKFQLEGNNMQYVTASTSIVSKVIEKQVENNNGGELDEFGWSVISSLPEVIAKVCMNCQTESSEFVSVMLKLLGRVGLVHGDELRPHLLEFLISTEVIKVMDDATLDHLVPVLYYSCLFMNISVLRVANTLSRFALKLMAIVEAHSNQLDENEAMLAYAFAVAVGKKNQHEDELAETALRIQTRFETEGSCL